MEFIRENQISIMLAFACCCGLLSLFSLIQLSTSKVRKYALLSMSLSAMFLLIADIQAYYFRGNTSPIGFMMTKVFNFIVFLMTLFVILSFNYYISDWFEKDFHLSINRLHITKLLCYVAIVLLIVSQFTDFYYYFDESNCYHRAKGYALSFIIPFIILITQLTVIIQHHQLFRKRLLYPLIFFTVVPVIASIAQIFMYGFSLINMSVVGIVILLRIFAVIDTNKIIKERQEGVRLFVMQASEALVSAIDAKDPYTNGHSKRVSDYSVMIAQRAGKNTLECEKIRIVALMHDVGKIGIPEDVINKDSKLNDEEYTMIKNHPVMGMNILSKIKIFPEMSIGAHYHHERYDGRGYPEGLKGEQIPEIARIIAVADTYDAMASKRSYRDVLPQEIVRQEIVKGIGTQFDPRFAQIMIQLIDEDKDYNLRQF